MDVRIKNDQLCIFLNHSNVVAFNSRSYWRWTIILHTEYHENIDRHLFYNCVDLLTLICRMDKIVWWIHINLLSSCVVDFEFQRLKVHPKTESTSVNNVFGWNSEEKTYYLIQIPYWIEGRSSGVSNSQAWKFSVKASLFTKFFIFDFHLFEALQREFMVISIQNPLGFENVVHFVSISIKIDKVEFKYCSFFSPCI